ncbi:MAG: GvpL/GvpF family gas vesicle protein [Beijerinckiaceae bacterium]
MGGVTGQMLVHAVMRAGSAPETAGLRVVDGTELVLVAEGNLLALASAFPVGHSTEDLLAEQETATRIALAHHTLLTTLSQDMDLAPVRLGAVYANAAAVQTMLQDEASRFATALEAISGACEFSVILTPLPGAKTPAAPVESTSGRAWLKRRSDTMAEKRDAAEHARACATQSLEKLTQFAKATVFAPPRRNAQADQEKRLLDAALLVSRQRITEFANAVVEAQDSAGAQGYALTARGPLPPYSFVSGDAAA